MRDPLPASVEAERFVLGSILLDPETLAPTLATLVNNDFSLESHRRIFLRMTALYTRGEHVDRISLYEELKRNNELESVGGLSYLISLDDGLPAVPNIDSYKRLLREKSALRRILHGCQHLANRATSGDTSAEISAAAQELFADVAACGSKQLRVADLPAVRDCGSAQIEYLLDPVLMRAAVVAFTGDSGSGKSTIVTAMARDLSVPVLFLDRENPLGVIVDRLDRLGFEDTPRVRFWGSWCAEEAPMPDSAAVIEWVKGCPDGCLLVLDSLSAFNPTDQNDAALMRNFMNRCRRLADLGATVAVIHHSGKGESSLDYRGSSDFKASIDVGFHVSNFGVGRLDRMLLRPWKQRVHVGAEIAYEYADGQFIRSGVEDARQTVNEQLLAVMRLNPGVTSIKFEELAMARGIGRSRARAYLQDGVLARSIRRENGAKNVKRHFLTGDETKQNSSSPKGSI